MKGDELLFQQRQQKQRNLETHKPCGRKVYWDLADNTKPYDALTNKEVPYWPDGTRHFCYACGANGWDSANDRPTLGCGVQLVQVDKEVIEKGEKVLRKIMVAAAGMGIKEHRCEYVRSVKGLRPRSKWHRKETSTSEKLPAVNATTDTMTTTIMVTEKDVTELKTRYEELDKRLNVFEETNKRIISAVKSILDAFAGVLVD